MTNNLRKQLTNRMVRKNTKFENTDDAHSILEQTELAENEMASVDPETERSQ